MPVIVASLMLYFVPDWALKLRWTGFWLEVSGLFIIGLRLWLVRKYFNASSLWATVVAWANALPAILRQRPTPVVPDDVTARPPVHDRPTLGNWPRKPPADAPDSERLVYLMRMAEDLRDHTMQLDAAWREQSSANAIEARKQTEEADRRLSAKTAELEAALQEIGAGNVQREQWAVFLLFLGAVLMLASTHV